MKAVETWTDLGLGNFSLHYLRDKNKNEVDFLVARDETPWLIAEVKSSDTAVSPALKKMQRQLGADVALQIIADLPYDDIDCLAPGAACSVPMRTFLSQLP